MGEHHWCERRDRKVAAGAQRSHDGGALRPSASLHGSTCGVSAVAGTRHRTTDRQLRLQEAAFYETDDGIACHDEMVEDAHVNQRQGVAEPGGNQFICLRRLRDSAGVVVGEYHCGGVAGQGFLDDLARVDAGAVHGAAEEWRELDDAVAVVEEEDREDFVLKWCELVAQVVAGVAGARERAAAADALGEDRSGCVEHLLVRGGAEGSFSVCGEEGAGSEQCRGRRRCGERQGEGRAVAEAMSGAGHLCMLAEVPLAVALHS